MLRQQKIEIRHNSLGRSSLLHNANPGNDIVILLEKGKRFVLQLRYSQYSTLLLTVIDIKAMYVHSQI